MHRSPSRFWLFCLFLSIASQSFAEDRVLSEAEKKAVDEYKSEVELGRNMAGRLLQYYGIYGDEDLIDYINTVGNYVANASDYKDRRFMFTILDSPIVNAFACPGGYILITRGTILAAKNEAELAAILGHEITHVGKRHVYTTLINLDEKSRNKLSNEIDKNQKTDSILKVRQRISSNANSEAGALLARYLSGSTGSSLSLLQAAKAGMSIILDKGLDKSLEFEADDLGVKLAVRAGYSPMAMENFLNRLKEAKKKELSMLEKTHPKIEDRATAVLATLQKIQAQDIIGADGENRFLKRTAKLRKTTDQDRNSQ